MGADKEKLNALRIDRTGEGEKRSRAWIFIALLLAAIAAAAAWWLTRHGPVEARVAVVRERALTAPQLTVLNASGYVTARRQATVSSKVTGKVVDVLIEEGMVVEDGQILAVLDQTNTRATLDVARAQRQAARSSLAETEARLKQARLNLVRTRELVSGRVSSQAELDAAKAEFDSLQARLARQKQDIKVAHKQVLLYETTLEDTVIRAPFAGIVVSKNAQPGEMISPVSGGGGFTRTGICTLVDMDSREIEVDVNESYINRVKAGQKVEATLDAYPSWKIPASVIAIVPTADRQKATVRVRIAFDGLDERILPDMGVKVAFQADEQAASSEVHAVLVVPQEALRSDRGQEIVFVVSGKTVERRAVQPGRIQGGLLQIVSGLRAGEKVVVGRPDDLSDGDTIREVPE